VPDFTRVIRDAYAEILERPPDPGGLDHYNRRMNEGLSEEALREALLRSEEYAIKYPLPGPGAGLALRVEGNRFLNARDEVVTLLGAIVCCEDAKRLGWPLVTLETVDLFAAHRLNYTHCRTGPFTVAGEEDPSYVGYVTTSDGRVDLDRFHAPFFERCRAVAARARQHRLYVEFDLVDRWVRQHGESDLPQVDPWSARNNVQGIDAGGLRIFESAPQPLHERWVRKVVAELGEFENVLFQVGNEGFKRFSAAWEVGVYEMVKDELRRRGFGDRLVATNTHDPGLESRLDYVTRHDQEAQQAGAKPILVTEYPSLPPDEVLRQVRRARRFGTSFMYWRGEHTQAQWESTLAQLRDIVSAEPVPLPALEAAASSPASAPPARRRGASRSR
jgi:hypothetical protein